MKNFASSSSFLFGLLSASSLFFVALPFVSADESLLQISRSPISSMIYEHTAPNEWQNKSVSTTCQGSAKVIDCLACRGDGCTPDVRGYSYNISSTDFPGYDKEYYLRIDDPKTCTLEVNAHFPTTGYESNPVRSQLNGSYSVQAICVEDALKNDDSSSVDVIDSPLQSMAYSHTDPGQWQLNKVSTSCPADTFLVNCLACKGSGCNPETLLFSNDIYGPGMPNHNVQYSLHSDGQNTCSFQLNAYFSSEGYQENIIRQSIQNEYSVKAKCIKIDSDPSKITEKFVDSPVGVMTYKHDKPGQVVADQVTTTCPADHHAVQCLVCRDSGCTTDIFDVSLDLHSNQISEQGQTEYVISKKDLSSCTLKLWASFPEAEYANNLYKNAHNQSHFIRAKCLNVASNNVLDPDSFIAFGTVTDTTGNPVSDVVVDYKNIAAGFSYPNAGSTNASGQVIFTDAFAEHIGTTNGWECTGGTTFTCKGTSGAPEGIYECTFKKEGYNEKKQSFSFADNQLDISTVLNPVSSLVPKDPDPIPHSPGCAIINHIINNLPDRFASVLDIFGDNRTLLNIFQCSENAVTFSAGKNDDNYYIWKQVYYSKDGKAWEADPLVLSGNNESEGWIIGQGTASATFADSEMKLTNYAAMYYCVWKDPNWKCGCSNAECAGDSARNWSLQSFMGAF